MHNKDINKTMLLQLFAEDQEPQADPTPEANQDQAGDTGATDQQNGEGSTNTEPVVYRDLAYKYKDERGTLGDVAPEDVVKNFQLGKKYAEHAGDIDFVKSLKTLYGADSTEALQRMFEEANENSIRQSMPEGIPEDQQDAWVAFQKQRQAEQAQAPAKEREARMMEQVESLKSSGRIKSIEDIPETVFDIYKARGYTDLQGALDSYQLEQANIKLKENQNAASSPGSLTGSPVIPKAKPVSQMTKSEYEAYKDQRRAVAAQANGG